MSHQVKVEGSATILEVLLKKTDYKWSDIFTVQSKVTGKDYTFKLRRSNMDSGKSFLHVYVETQYLEFRYLGHYWNGQILRKGGKIVDSPSAVALAWCLRRIERGHINDVNEQIMVFHTGKCAKCKRTLTDALSIKLGIGPHCRNLNN